MHIKVKVTPGAKRNFLKKISENVYAVSVKEKAQKNMANKAVLLMLKEHLKVASMRLKIVSGHRANSKIIFFQ